MAGVRPSLVLAAALALAPHGAVAQTGPLQGLDAYIRQSMKDWGVPGLAIAVVKDDSVIYAQGFGVRTLGQPGAVDANTLFNIASTTKAFTVAALGTLVDDGKISWDDPVTSRLPEFELSDPYVTREVRIRDLLSHRVGVARDDNLWIAAPRTRTEIIQHLRYLPQITSFRSRYGYNNLMFITAGELAARVAGTSWDDLVKERIFTPLGMTRTTTYTDVVNHEDNVSGSHAKIDGKVQVVPRRNYDRIGGAGAIWSSVHDMAQWVRMQLGHGEYQGKRILSDAALDQMRKPTTLIPIDSVERRLFPRRYLDSYGLGWDVREYRGHLLVEHAGYLNNTRTQVSMLPELGIGVVAIANLNVSDLQQGLAYRAFDALLGEPAFDWSGAYLELLKRGEARSAVRTDSLNAARLKDAPPSVPLERYAGTYTSDLWGAMKVTVEDGHLVLDYAPDFVADLEPWHHDIFRAVWRTAGDGRSFVTFTLDERARITGMEVEDFGEYHRGPSPTGDGAANGAPILFYLHGAIVESQGADAVSPDFGRYDYRGIVSTFESAGFDVRSEVRKADTDPQTYADSVAGQVRRLVDSGVAPSRITVVGASKGGVINLLTSSEVDIPGIRYVILASCNESMREHYPLHLHGDVLSIYEASDDIGKSCQAIFGDSPALGAHDEIRLNTGLRHGFLYRPIPEWVEPALEWARR